MNIVFLTPFFEESVFSPLSFSSLFKYQMIVVTSTFVYIFYFIQLVHLSIFFQYHNVSLTTVIYLEVCKGSLSNIPFAENCFDYLESFLIPHDFFFCFYDKCYGYFDWNCTESINFRRMAIFIMLFLLIFEYVILSIFQGFALFLSSEIFGFC